MLHKPKKQSIKIALLTVVIVAIIFLLTQFLRNYQDSQLSPNLQGDEMQPDPSQELSEAEQTRLQEQKALSDANRARLSRGCFTGKDCIPSIDSPIFWSIEEMAASDFMSDDDLVLSIELDGIAKAYPIKILNYHEIVNDFFGEKPVLVTFCPLCFSGVAYYREISADSLFKANVKINDRPIDPEKGSLPIKFGVSGKLLNSNLVMYDRLTESYWEQISGEAIVGPLIGEKLQFINAWTITWQEFQNRFPEGTVLSPETGFNRDYDAFPYGDYNQNHERIMFRVENEDNRLPSKTLIYGVFGPNDTFKAYPLEFLDNRLPEGGEFEDTIADTQVTISFQNGIFEASTIDPPAEEESTILIHQIGFFFSWAAFFPDTEIFVYPENALDTFASEGEDEEGSEEDEAASVDTDEETGEPAEAV